VCFVSEAKLYCSKAKGNAAEADCFVLKAGRYVAQATLPVCKAEHPVSKARTNAFETHGKSMKEKRQVLYFLASHCVVEESILYKNKTGNSQSFQ